MMQEKQHPTHRRGEHQDAATATYHNIDIV